MINEKALCVAMKRAWKETGYEVFARGDSLVISTDELCVEMLRKNASRQVLALLVVHLGEIPDGTAYSVRKKDGAQQVMLDVALGRWEGARNRVEGAERRILRRTSMDWKGRGVWQEDDTGIVYTIDKSLTDIIIAEPEGIEIADRLMVCDDGGGLVVVRPEHSVMDEAVRNLLEQVSLT